MAEARYPKPLVEMPRWMLILKGRPYRLLMRFGHRHGWCFPQRSEVQPQMVWCHWCGMRGRTPKPVNEAEMELELAARTPAPGSNEETGT